MNGQEKGPGQSALPGRLTVFLPSILQAGRAVFRQVDALSKRCEILEVSILQAGRAVFRRLPF